MKIKKMGKLIDPKTEDGLEKFSSLGKRNPNKVKLENKAVKKSKTKTKKKTSKKKSSK